MPNIMSQGQKKGRAPQGKPMSESDRVFNYEERGRRDTHDGFTGPQRRRIRKKSNHLFAVEVRELRARKAAERERRNAAARARRAAAKAAKATETATETEAETPEEAAA